jgi:hypothetical protein
MRLIPRTLLLAGAVLLAGCASLDPRAESLDRAQYAWSGAIRWGDFDGATSLVDPEHLEQHPVTGLDLRRYEQVEISHYRDHGASQNLEAGTAAREIEIGVVNRHTLTERKVDYRETWRYDAEADRWWNTSGLPDLWDGD